MTNEGYKGKVDRAKSQYFTLFDKDPELANAIASAMLRMFFELGIPDNTIILEFIINQLTIAIEGMESKVARHTIYWELVSAEQSFHFQHSEQRRKIQYLADPVEDNHPDSLT